MSAPVVVGYVLKRFPRLSETFILRELLELERLGPTVVVFALGRTEEATVHADYARLRARVIYVDELPEAPAFEPARAASGDDTTRRHARLAWRLAPAVMEAGVTHLHAHFATAAADVARRVGALLFLPYSVTAHAKDIFHESVSRDELERLVSDAAFIVTVSDYNVRHLRTELPSVPTPIHRLYNGIDTLAHSSPVPPYDGPDRILGVGRLVEKKGFDVFIDAMAALRALRPNLTATIIGTGRCEASLRARVLERGLDGCLTMAGAQAQDQVLAAMRGHSVLAVPCVVGEDGDRDGLPTVIIEAMACGLPVVSTPVTGIPEIVRHASTGLIVPERSPFALAEAIARLLDDEPLHARLATMARQLVEREFDARHNARGLAELFARSSASTGPPAARRAQVAS